MDYLSLTLGDVVKEAEDYLAWNFMNLLGSFTILDKDDINNKDKPLQTCDSKLIAQIEESFIAQSDSKNAGNNEENNTQLYNVIRRLRKLVILQIMFIILVSCSTRLTFLHCIILFIRNKNYLIGRKIESRL